jgi:hypothetical protein
MDKPKKNNTFHAMETNEKIEQLKDRHTLITIVIVAGIIITFIINLLMLLNCWSMIGYAQWEFGAFTHDPDIQEVYRTVFDVLLVQMLVVIVSTVFIMIFYAKLLSWKKWGFWGYAITSVVTTAAMIVMSSYITKAFSKIEVDVPNNNFIQIVWTLATIALLYAILQIKKNGVSCWEQLE